MIIKSLAVIVLLTFLLLLAYLITLISDTTLQKAYMYVLLGGLAYSTYRNFDKS